MKSQLHTALNSLTEASSKPIIFNFAKDKDKKTAASLIQQKKIQTVSDDYKEQQKELFAINHPTWVYSPNFEQKFENYFKNLESKTDLLQDGRWIYFPWLATLVHVLKDSDFQKVRTARNRNLISTEEQKKFYNSSIGIGGLSVGNSVILSIVLQGGARHIKLADFDRLALSNLNRIRSGIESMGLRKVDITARQIYQLNPYAEVELFPDGLNLKNIDRFFNGSKPLDLVIDELDNLAVKYMIREKARQYKIPVVMGADDGDNAVVDIERYDLKKSTQFFHGRLGKNISYSSLLNLDKFGIGRTITQHIGPENITEKMQNSLLQMGKTIVSWPQLGGAALLNGSAVAYCVRRILNGQSIENNRAIISLDEKLIPEYFTKREVKTRASLTKSFKKLMNL